MSEKKIVTLFKLNDKDKAALLKQYCQQKVSPVPKTRSRKMVFGIVGVAAAVTLAMVAGVITGCGGAGTQSAAA